MHRAVSRLRRSVYHFGVRSEAEHAERSIAGRYAVLGLLGEGGMGAVYHVRDQRDGREVALKRLGKSKSVTTLNAELFEREFHTLSELAHPCIIEVYDYGIDEEGAYYTMELLGGQDLRALGRVDWRKTCELLRDVASSLAIVHSRRLLHGDLSPRNVRCTFDGRAKLLDFGAMAPMGVAKHVVGTPPFIAPEMVQLQGLDGRTDLYALGALGYWLLTGRHAYPAATVRQLRDRWRTPPAPPSAIDPKVPASLSDLVMELLQLNRSLRPRTAGTVMERLCAIAGLPLDEQPDVAQAYLTTPALVGRDEQLGVVRERMVASSSGKGGTIVVQGPSGSGRSRFLDACVLEAKLLGSHVIRADRGDAETRSHGVASALCHQLFELAPETAKRAARLHAPVLAHVLGADLVTAAPSAVRPERRVLQLALRDFVLSLVRSLRIVVVVDDADRIDEASASLLTALAQKARRRPLCLLLALDADGEGSAALDAIAGAAQHVDLPALTEQQTEQLLGSVFGQAKHTLTVARSVHVVACGSPRATMQLAAYLMDQGIARYEAGSFVLPDRLLPDDLPSSLAAALAGRLSALDSDALELAQALALTDPSELPTANYVELSSHADRSRTYRAIDQLVRLRILEPQGERYRLSDPNWRAAMAEGLSDDQRVALHARLARAFEHGGTLPRRSYHLMESADAEAAIRLLLVQHLKDPNEPRDPLADHVPGMLDLLERAAKAAQSLWLPAAWQVELRMKVAGASQYLGDLSRFKRVAFPLLETLERDSGLFEYHALDTGMEPMARLTEALTRVQQGHDAAPERERGLPPADAIRELTRVCAMFAGMFTTAQDPALLDRIPSLAPFVPLSPAVGVIQQTIEATREVWAGRDVRARELLLKLVNRVEQPDRAGLGELYADSVRLGALQGVGLMEATTGIPTAVERMVEHEKTPGYRINAYRVYMACHLMQGDTDAAAVAQRRAEMVMLEDGQLQRFPGMTVRAEVFAHWLAGDAAGLKDVSERVLRLVKQYPAWQILADVARCLHRHMQGDHASALAALAPVLAAVRPGEHRDWAWAAACHVQVLVGLDRSPEAVEIGLEAMEVCEREALSGHRRVAQATSEALIAAGRPQQAGELVDQLIDHAKSQGVRGIVLGSLYELRARAAVACEDGAAYRGFAERCAAEYRLDRNPALAARFQRLCRAAEPEGLQPPDAAVPWGSSSEAASAVLTSVHSRLFECPDRTSRTRCVLAILAEHANAECAYLYGERDGKLALLQSIAEAAPPPALGPALERYLQRELQQDEATVVDDVGSSRDDDLDSRSEAPEASIATFGGSETWTAALDGALLVHASGLRIYPVLLVSSGGRERTIGGVAALASRSHDVPAPPSSLVAALAAALLDHDDVDPVTCFS